MLEIYYCKYILSWKYEELISVQKLIWTSETTKGEKHASILFSYLKYLFYNAPCHFGGHVNGSQDKIYIGQYVDDFIYFGDSDNVEQQFETIWNPP